MSFKGSSAIVMMDGSVTSREFGLAGTDVASTADESSKGVSPSKKSQGRKPTVPHKINLAAAIFVMFASLVIVLGVVMSQRDTATPTMTLDDNTSDPTSGSTGTTSPPSLRASTSSPTNAPTSTKTYAPTISRLTVLTSLLADDAMTPESLLLDMSTPQHRALEWLAADDQSLSLEEIQAEGQQLDQLIQRYYVAIFFFATTTAGTNTNELFTDDDDDLWLSTTTSVCEWRGVTCDMKNEFVTDLTLPNNNLSGIIPSELGGLTSMTNIDLSMNNLTGTIPTNLGLLTGLESLALDYNMLNGTIPIEFGQMTSLLRLSLESNRLTGTIPNELSQLVNLTHLSIESNELVDNANLLFCDITNFSSISWRFVELNSLEMDCAVGNSTTSPKVVCFCCTNCSV